MVFQRLSERRGLREPDSPYDGVPPHLEYDLHEWIENALQSTGEAAASAQKILRVLRVQVVKPGPYWTLIAEARSDEDFCLDVIDLLVAARVGDLTELENLLATGGSVWKVQENEGERPSLQLRTPESQRHLAEIATTPDDDVSSELRQAFQHLYGRNPDESDAWDHAIKAVEAAYVPLVIPNQSNPNLGQVAGHITSTSEQWDYAINDTKLSGTKGTHLANLIQSMWANPDRHKGSQESRKPTPVEAETAVLTATYLIALQRLGISQTK